MNSMSNTAIKTVQVSFRLPHDLVERMREVSSENSWPPPPTQTDIVTRGIELVLKTLEKRSARAKAS